MLRISGRYQISILELMFLTMAKAGDLDNVVLAKRGTTRYLRSKRDQLSANNLQEVIVGIYLKFVGHILYK